VSSCRLCSHNIVYVVVGYIYCIYSPHNVVCQSASYYSYCCAHSVLLHILAEGSYTHCTSILSSVVLTRLCVKLLVIGSVVPTRLCQVAGYSFCSPHKVVCQVAGYTYSFCSHHKVGCQVAGYSCCSPHMVLCQVAGYIASVVPTRKPCSSSNSTSVQHRNITLHR
jgi:hypothetical protein